MGDRYRNVGGPHRRADGSWVAHGDIFEPTERELAAFPDKWRRVGPKPTPPVAAVPVAVAEEPDSVGDPPTERDLDPDAEPEVEPEQKVADYATGGGWYDIPGVGKVKGREAATRALEHGAHD